MISVHDNQILSFKVDYENESLSIETLYNDGGEYEHTLIIFSGYLTHLFLHQQKGSIILDLEEQSISDFIKYNSDVLQQGIGYGYPILYNHNSLNQDGMLELQDYLSQNEYKAFELQASFGMDGWIVAKKLEIRFIS